MPSAVFPDDDHRSLPSCASLDDPMLTSVRAYLAHERRFHWGSDAIDHGDARASAPGRGRAGRIVGHHPLLVVPVVRGPDVACGVNRHLGDHLDAAALKLVDDIPSLG